MDDNFPYDEIEVEHTRLLQQMEALEREHQDLERRPYDRIAHNEHLRRLAEKKAELRQHMLRLKRRREELEDR